MKKSSVIISGWREKRGSLRGDEVQNYMTKNKKGICSGFIHLNTVQRPTTKVNRQLYRA